MNNNSDKKKIVWIAAAAFVVVAVLSGLLSYSLSEKSPENDAGLFKSASMLREENRPVRQMEQDRLDEYESREEMPTLTEDIFYETISRFLSSGNFDTLDNTLRHWQEAYKDSVDESESKAAVIARYRGDIACYKSITNSDAAALPAWHFKMSDTLAASAAYSPVMKKYAAFISQDSLIMPAVSAGTNISLRKSDKTNEELSEIRSQINRTRRAETAFQQIAVYDMTLFGYPCQFIAVMDKDTMSWMPYSLQVTNNMIDLPAVSFGKDVLRNNPGADLDAMIVIPAAISERPEGMDGNIDREQEGIPDSQSISMPDLNVNTEPAENESGAANEPDAEPEASALTASAGVSEQEADIASETGESPGTEEQDLPATPENNPN